MEVWSTGKVDGCEDMFGEKAWKFGSDGYPDALGHYPSRRFRYGYLGMKHVWTIRAAVACPFNARQTQQSKENKSRPASYTITEAWIFHSHLSM